MGKRGQMKLSFGMIFSIILIIIFIAFAIYTINIFLGIQKSASSGKLFNDVQRDVDKIWNSEESLREFEYFLPRGVDSVCFVDFSSDKKGIAENLYNDLERISFREGNFVLYSEGLKSGSDFSSKEIENINIEQTTYIDNPLCFRGSSGKVKITLKKDFNESSVTIVK